MLSPKSHSSGSRFWSAYRPSLEQISMQALPAEAPAQGIAEQAIAFHAKTIDACLNLLQSRFTGLTEAEAAERRHTWGINAIDGKPFQVSRRLFLCQFKNLVVYLLLGAGVLSFAIGDYVGGTLIFLAMMLNILMNVLADWKTQQSSIDLNDFKNSTITVKRDRRNVQIPATEVVPGDILVVSPGQLVAADARLLFSEGLQVDEALLTGESVLVTKDGKATHAPQTDLSKQSNMLFSGTRVKTGWGEAVVTAIGEKSVMGRIASLATMTEKRNTPFTQGLNRLGITIFLGVVLVATGVVALEYYRGTPLPHLLPLALILLVAAVPQTLTSMTTFILSMGLDRLSKEHIFVKNLHAFESIGAATVLCTDKTGTLTENSFTLNQVYVPDLGIIPYQADWRDGNEIPCESVDALLHIARNANSTVMDGLRSSIMGDPIDIALFRATPAIFSAGYRPLKDYPFNQQLMKMAKVCRIKATDGSGDEQIIAMIKGAPEAVIADCGFYMRPDGSIVEMDRFMANEFLLINRDMAVQGALRVIGFALKFMDAEMENPYGNAVFVGWISLEDPLKPGVTDTIEFCRNIGVEVTMITGDQKATAAVIGHKLGLLKGDSEVWTRRDLDCITDGVPSNVRIFARTKPEEKLVIVESLQLGGEVVAMVGDGVNDTPALQKSDIAIAMGIHGADAAKESADILLLNDRFEGIVTAILESRYLINNVKLTAEYLLSCNLSLVMLAVLAAVLGVGQPLHAVQILWLNVISVTFPAIAFAFVPPSPSALGKPVSARERLPMDRQRMALVVFWSLLIAAAGLGMYCYATLWAGYSHEVAATLTFCAVALCQILNLLNIQFVHAGRRLWAYLFDALSVPALWLVFIVSIVIQAAAVHLPMFNILLKTTSIEPELWLLPAGFAAGMIFLSMFLLDVRQVGD